MAQCQNCGEKIGMFSSSKTYCSKCIKTVGNEQLEENAKEMEAMREKASKIKITTLENVPGSSFQVIGLVKDFSFALVDDKELKNNSLEDIVANIENNLISSLMFQTCEAGGNYLVGLRIEKSVIPSNYSVGGGGQLQMYQVQFSFGVNVNVYGTAVYSE